jgi:aldose 1-epimerase
MSPLSDVLVCIAPEFGSNTFRFRAGEHNLIYADQALLKNKGFTGKFVLWPFPNRVRGKRYTYGGLSLNSPGIRSKEGTIPLVHKLPVSCFSKILTLE